MGHLMIDSKGWPYDSFDCLSFTSHHITSIKRLHMSGTVYVSVCSKNFPSTFLLIQTTTYFTANLVSNYKYLKILLN